MTATRIKRKKLYMHKGNKWIVILSQIKQKMLVLLCILSLYAVKENSFICVLPLVIMQMCTDKISMYLCASVSVAYYISTFLHTAFYVPCVSFALVYILGDYMLQQGKIKPVWFAVAVFAVCKLYVLSFGYQTVYFVVFAVETMAVIMLPQIICDGAEFIRNGTDVFLPPQLLAASAALLLTAAALSGINIYGFNVPVCFLFSSAIYFVAKENIPLSLTAFICMSVAVCQDKNFSFLFVGFMVIYLGSSTLVTKGEKGYLYTAILALAVSVLFITKFNSFVFLTVTTASLCAVFVADKYIPFSKVKTDAQTVGEKDYIQLTQQIDRLNRCFNFLGHTVIDISNLMTKEDIPKDIADMAANKVCRKCKNNTYCWQENYSHTQSQFSAFAVALQQGKRADFDSLFLSRCDKTEILRTEFAAANRLENAKQLVYRNGRHNQGILQKQFLTISQVLEDITRQTATTGVVNAAYTYTINTFVQSMGKTVQQCICYQNKAKCVIVTAEEFEYKELERIRIKLENIYGERFGQTEKTQAERDIVYTFCQKPQYTCEFDTHSKSRHSVCGDICGFFQNEDEAFVILADGMGTGSFAAAESRTAVTMLKSLLTSGVKAETAMEITNTAINLKGTGQSCVALDVLCADCSSGRCTLYKAGAASTVTINKGRVSKLYKDSLPIGILKETRIAKTEFALENGGTVVMASDGINITEEMICKIQMMNSKLSAGELSRFVADSCSNIDDATAAVFRFIRT